MAGSYFWFYVHLRYSSNLTFLRVALFWVAKKMGCSASDEKINSIEKSIHFWDIPPFCVKKVEMVAIIFWVYKRICTTYHVTLLPHKLEFRLENEWNCWNSHCKKTKVLTAQNVTKKHLFIEHSSNWPFNLTNAYHLIFINIFQLKLWHIPNSSN